MLKSCGVVGGRWVVGGLQQFSVSLRPLGFWFFSFWVLGLRVWGQGLTIFTYLENQEKPKQGRVCQRLLGRLKAESIYCQA